MEAQLLAARRKHEVTEPEIGLLRHGEEHSFRPIGQGHFTDTSVSAKIEQLRSVRAPAPPVATDVSLDDLPRAAPQVFNHQLLPVKIPNVTKPLAVRTVMCGKTPGRGNLRNAEVGQVNPIQAQVQRVAGPRRDRTLPPGDEHDVRFIGGPGRSAPGAVAGPSAVRLAALEIKDPQP